MRKLRYLAIGLTLVEVILVVSLVHGASLAKVSAVAYSFRPVYHAAGADNSNALSYASSPQETYSLDDSHLAERWGVNKIAAPQAWQIAKGDQSIVVAVLDIGIDEDNRDLADKMVAGVNSTNSPKNDDLYGHGTHMAGTIAAITPECRLMNAKVADDESRYQASVVAGGIIWVVDEGAKVINASLCTKSSPDLKEAVNYVWNQGVLIMLAAGNGGSKYLPILLITPIASP